MHTAYLHVFDGRQRQNIKSNLSVSSSLRCLCWALSVVSSSSLVWDISHFSSSNSSLSASTAQPPASSLCPFNLHSPENDAAGWSPKGRHDDSEWANMKTSEEQSERVGFKGNYKGCSPWWICSSWPRSWRISEMRLDLSAAQSDDIDSLWWASCIQITNETVWLLTMTNGNQRWRRTRVFFLSNYVKIFIITKAKTESMSLLISFNRKKITGPKT